MSLSLPLPVISPAATTWTLPPITSAAIDAARTSLRTDRPMGTSRVEVGLAIGCRHGSGDQDWGRHAAEPPGAPATSSLSLR